MQGQEAERRAGQARNYQRTPPEVTTVELAGIVNGHIDTLIEGMKAGRTEHLTSYLAFSSRFHRYSRRNQELIFSQCPQATRVASWKKWHDEGYTVAHMDKTKGERGIRI